MRVTTRLVWAVTAVIAAAPGAGAPATPPLPVSNVVTVGLTYVPGDEVKPTAPLEMVRGGSLRFTNLDIDLHTLTSFATIGGEPLFETEQLAFGQTTEVPGVERLTPGEYLFYCRVHPPMQGRLRVLT